MVDEENAKLATNYLRMIVAGLAEEAIELVSRADAPDRAQQVVDLTQLEHLGRDIAHAASAAAMALKRCRISPN